MEAFFNYVTFSRMQFGLTAMFHILWPVLTIGLSLFLVYMEVMWLRTKDEVYYRHARFWSRLFVLNFVVGAVTGIPMEFQFGTNWGRFSAAGGDFFGHILGFEAAMAFMLEATFLGIMIFGWKRVSVRMHLFATSMVALGSSLSAFWIMAASSWMQTPTGGFFHEGVFVLTSHLEAIFNPDMVWGVSHMWFAALEVTAFVVGGVSAWYILRDRHVAFFLRSFRMAVVVAVIVSPIQIWLGDGSGGTLYEHQPTKLAALEAHWQTNPPGEGASWKVLAWPDKAKQDNDWSIEIPNGLSLILTHSSTGTVRGLREFPVEDQPPILPTFYAFRIMIACGLAFFLLSLATLWAWLSGSLTVDRIRGRRRLLQCWLAALPLSYLALESGWVTREVGRQPWLLYGLLRTNDSATAIPANTVAMSLLGFAVAYVILFSLFVLFARRILARGPE